MIDHVQRPTIAFTASPATWRRGGWWRKGGTAFEFVAEHRERLRNYQIVTTQDVCDGLFRNKPDLSVEPKQSYDDGGLTAIANEIVEGRYVGVITFADLKNPASQTSPENITIFNRALGARIPIMINPCTAGLWLTGQTGVVRPEEETLALIAHSEAGGRCPKAEIIKLADEYQEEFSRFHRILCTKTTGQTLIKAVPRLSSKIVTHLNDIEIKSGMGGGDCQIANEIDRGMCNFGVFFANELWAQPHQADVQSFMNTCRRRAINLMFTYESACRWAGLLRAQFQEAA